MLPQEKKRIFFRWLKQNNLYIQWKYNCHHFPSVNYTFDNWETYLMDGLHCQNEYARFRQLVSYAPFQWISKTNPRHETFSRWDNVSMAWRIYVDNYFKNIISDNDGDY